MQSIAELVDRCFRCNQLTANEDDLSDGLRELARTVVALYSSRTDRLVAFSAACRRVRELELVDHPEAIVKAAFDEAGGLG